MILWWKWTGKGMVTDQVNSVGDAKDEAGKGVARWGINLAWK